MTTLNIWTHPATGAKRVYISGFGQTKVWAEEQAADAFGDTIRIVSVNPNKNGSELGNIKNEAEREINTLAQKRVKSFADLLALAAK